MRRAALGFAGREAWRSACPTSVPLPLGTLVNAGLMKLHQIADALGCRLAGDGEVEIHGVAGMEHATAGQLTFLANPKYAPKVKHTKASAILVGEAVQGLHIACLVSATLIWISRARWRLFYQPPRPAPGDSSAGLRRAQRDASAKTLPSAPSRWWENACASAATPCCIRTS